MSPAALRAAVWVAVGAADPGGGDQVKVYIAAPYGAREQVGEYAAT